MTSPTVRQVAVGVRASVRRAGRWRGAVVVAWVVGAIGGVAPTAFLGEPPAGLVAAAALGLLAVAMVAPVLIGPLVATLVCDDDEHQVAVAWHGVGVDPRRRISARASAAATASLRLLPVGALGGLLAGAGSAAAAPDPLRVGLAGGPRPMAVLVGVVLVVVSWVLGALVGAWAVTAIRAVLVLLVSLIVTGAVAGLLYFAPSLRLLFWVTPWAALWPFDPQSFDSAQFATSVPVVARVASGWAWLTVLALATVRRRRLVPYPVPGEQRRRRR